MGIGNLPCLLRARAGPAIVLMFSKICSMGFKNTHCYLEIRNGGEITRKTIVLFPLFLGLLLSAMSLSVVSVATAAGPRPSANFSVQSVGPIGIWFGGVIYSDGTTSGGGSICHVEDEFPFTFLGPAEVYQVRGYGDQNSWIPGTGTLTLWGIFKNPLNGATFGPIPLVISGLSEGNNKVLLFGGLHIIVVNTIR